MIGSKFSRHFFNQSEVKPKPIVARACTFSRALCLLRVITSSFDWFTGSSPSLLIGFGFTTLHLNALYYNDNNEEMIFLDASNWQVEGSTHAKKHSDFFSKFP